MLRAGQIDWEQMLADYAANAATEYAIAKAQTLKADALIDMDMLPGRI